jgi:hypothetical protein
MQIFLISILYSALAIAYKTLLNEIFTFFSISKQIALPLIAFFKL